MAARGLRTLSRLRRLRNGRLANGLAALVLLCAGLLGTGLALVAGLLWSGWVLPVLLVPAGWFAYRWMGGLGLKALARDVERRLPELDGRLVAALELAGYEDGSREGYSVELVDAAVEDVERRVGRSAFRGLVSRKRLVWSGLAALVGAGALLGFLAVAPERAELGLVNAFAPSRVDIGFAVIPGDTTVLPGGELELGCMVQSPVRIRKVRLEMTGEETESRVVLMDSKVCLVPVRATSGFSYRFRVLGIRSEEYRVSVLEPVRVEQLGFTYRYPSYSGLEEFRSSSTDIAALSGTRIEVAGEASQPLSAGRLAFAGDTAELELVGERGFRGEFEVTADARGRLELATGDPAGFQPVEELRVRAVPDEPPLVKLLMPGRDVDLPMSMKLGLVINSLDDYGLSAVRLHWSRDSVYESKRVGSPGGAREDTTYHGWDLSEAGLLPGDVVTYYVTVTDNDVVSGPKQGKTPLYRVRFPTMAEIYQASVRQTERTTEELAPLRDAQEELGEELARIADQVRSEGELSWEERQALEQVLAEQQDLAQDISELRDEVAQLMEDLFEGVALDQETMERLAQLHELLSEMLPRELQESLARLQQELDQESPDVREALERFEMDQEQLEQSIEQALEFLERVMEEQKLEELARKAEDLARAEEEIRDRAAEGDTSGLADMQDAVGAGLDSLLQELQDLAATMSDSVLADSLAALAEGARADSLPQMSDEVSSQLREGSQSEASANAGEMAKKMREMSESLSGMSSGLKKKRSAEVAGQLAAAAEELLMVSRLQELLESAAKLEPDLSERAAFQMGLHDATGLVAESLAALGSRTMSVSGRVVQELTRAMGTMKASAQTMVENRSGPARRQMSDARATVDRVVAMLLAAMEQAQGGGGMSGSMESMMQQLSQMSADQMAINAGTSGMPIPMPGGMSSAQMQALSQLLSQQAALRQRLEQLLEQMGGERPGLTSSLEGLLDEMREVEQDMADLNIDRELIERQESILSHLLDAQRSVRQRGFKEERESEAAREFERGPSPELPEDLGERNRLLREELIRALRQGDLGDYEQMIRAYFETLLYRE